MTIRTPDELPHNEDAEASILGGIILRSDVLRRLGLLEVEDFYDNRHKVVFQAIRNLEAVARPIDVVTLENEIAKAGKLDAVGGVAFLGELTLRVPTVDNVVTYAEIVQEHSRNRRLAIELSEALDRARRGVHAPAELLSETIGELQRIERQHMGGVHRGFAPMSERVIGEREERLRNAARGIPFHNAFLDDRLRMILPHDLVILTARTGSGKTALATTFAMANVLKRRRAGYFALEAEPRELERRVKYAWIVGEAYARRLPFREELDYTDWLIGKLDDKLGDLEAEADRWFQAELGGFWTYYKGVERFDSDRMTTEMMEIARRVEMIVLDHLHYVDERDGEDELRAQSRLAHALRNIALGIGRPVLAVAHLRKPVGIVRTLIPDEHEILGHSNISKIATQIIAIAPARFVEPRRWWEAPTLLSVVKERRAGKDGLAALCMFDLRTHQYANEYTLGRLIKGDTEWEQLSSSDLPRWARGHRQLEMELRA